MYPMKYAAILVLVLVLAGLGCGGGGGDHSHDPGPTDPWYITYANDHPIAVSEPVTFEELEMIDLINAHRVAAGVDALIEDPAMTDLAKAHSIHMEIGSFLDSRNPEGDGPRDRADIAGVFWLGYEEIVAAGPFDPFVIFDAFLTGPEHPILDDPFWTHIGVGNYLDFRTVDFAWQ